MGNLCGKPSSTSNTANDPFSGPGRTLGSAPARGENPRAAVPAAQKISSSKGGQTLGGGAMNGSQGGGERGEPTSAAARAAEVCPPTFLSILAVWHKDCGLVKGMR